MHSFTSVLQILPVLLEHPFYFDLKIRQCCIYAHLFFSLWSMSIPLCEDQLMQNSPYIVNVTFI